MPPRRPKLRPLPPPITTTKRVSQKRPRSSSAASPAPVRNCWYRWNGTIHAFRPGKDDSLASEPACVTFLKKYLLNPEPVIQECDSDPTTIDDPHPRRVWTTQPPPIYTEMAEDMVAEWHFRQDLDQAKMRVAVQVWQRMMVDELAVGSAGTGTDNRKRAKEMLPRMMTLMGTETEDQWDVKREDDTPENQELRRVAFRTRATLKRLVDREAMNNNAPPSQDPLVMNWNQILCYMVKAVEAAFPPPPPPTHPDAEFMTWWIEVLENNDRWMEARG